MGSSFLSVLGLHNSFVLGLLVLLGPVSSQLVVKLTKDIIDTYQSCNPDFKYSEALNPKRYLTSPSIGVLNDGRDNANSDLILTPNYVLINVNSKRRYVVKDVLGQGTFGQVAKCWVSETNSYVAIKIIKNQPAYYQQALVEVSLLKTLNHKFDPEDTHHIVRIHEFFVFQRHLCISFELLDTNLYELLKINDFKGLPLHIVQVFTRQILCALVLMKDAGIIHCDLKPENILLCTSVKPPAIKVIDFGSACLEDRTVYSYIQSRYYRSPEVLLGYRLNNILETQVISMWLGGFSFSFDTCSSLNLALRLALDPFFRYTTAIDMWSLGCIVSELFLGLPLFPGASEFDLLRRMIKILGGQPPDHLLNEASNTVKFFKPLADATSLEKKLVSFCGRSKYGALNEQEYEAKELKKPLVAKEYFKHVKLEEIVTSYPHRKNLDAEEITREKITRLAMIDFLRGLMEFDPAKRWSPLQASKHPFVTGEAFKAPYKPLPETPYMRVIPNKRLSHNPGGGHWFPAGLSPQVISANRGLQQSSPQFQNAQFSHSGSYGSLGSHGSYTDGAGYGSSYGSYGDDNSMYTYYSPGLNIHAQNGGVSAMGTSQFSHGNGPGFSPMSLGASPSQFTPPKSHIQVPTGSPGKYGPTSPARGGGIHGSPLGRGMVVNPLNRRKSWGNPGIFPMQPQENASSIQSPSEGNSRGQGGSPRSVQSSSNMPNWRLQRGNARSTSGSFAPSSSVSHSMPSEVTFEKPESSLLPDPGDWDPNYSDELLLQEDSSETSSLASELTNGMRLNHTVVSTAGVGRFNSASYQPTTNPVLFNQRTNGPVQTYSHAEMGSPPSDHNIYDMHAGGYTRPVSKHSHSMPHFSQNSPSRFFQQPVQMFNYGQPTFPRGGQWNHHMVQPPLSNFNNMGPHSSDNNTYMASSSCVGRLLQRSFVAYAACPVADSSAYPVGLNMILHLEEHVLSVYDTKEAELLYSRAFFFKRTWFTV
ncbi:hypothetical protein GIB67_038390 [Kingdonia uniflora]|uniref:Protein kinase domain-containing protein n=1 Tax=Kingdonia uniflora TaxID=39325 RepID=A0A7J7NP50_9MAGN|nr:hypothetical protein GIB67_038390 [Kingdonia uniflora]